MLIWGSISTPPRTPLSRVLQKQVTPNHNHSCRCTLHPTMENTYEDFFGNQTSREVGLRGQGGNPLLRAELWCQLPH